MTASEIDEEIFDDINRAELKYGPMTSSHEGLGVLVEEMAELVEAIRSNKSESIRREAIQVAAVSTRIAYAMSDPETITRSGGGS